MEKMIKTVLIIHISTIVAWVLQEAMGLSAYIFGPSGEGKMASKSVVAYFHNYLYYVNPAIYLLTLAFFIGVAIYQGVNLYKEKKKENK